MSRRRYVSTEISTDTAVNRLATRSGDFAALLYTWMIPHAADDASLPGDPEELLLIVVPGRRDKSPDDVAEALRAMVDLGLVEWDEAGVRFPARSFYKYQTYIRDGNRRRARNTDEQREDAQNGANSAEQRRTAHNAVSFSPSPSPSFPPPPSVVPPVAPQGAEPAPSAPEPAQPPRSERQRKSDEVFNRKWPIVLAYFRGLDLSEGSIAWNQRKGPALAALTPDILASPECVPEIVEPLTRYALGAYQWRDGKKTPSLAEVLIAFPEWEAAGRPDQPPPKASRAPAAVTPIRSGGAAKGGLTPAELLALGKGER